MPNTDWMADRTEEESGAEWMGVELLPTGESDSGDSRSAGSRSDSSIDVRTCCSMSGNSLLRFSGKSLLGLSDWNEGALESAVGFAMEGTDCRETVWGG